MEKRNLTFIYPNKFKEKLGIIVIFKIVYNLKETGQILEQCMVKLWHQSVIRVPVY